MAKARSLALLGLLSIVAMMAQGAAAHFGREEGREYCRRGDHCPALVDKCKKADCDGLGCGTPNKYITFFHTCSNSGGTPVNHVGDCCNLCRKTAGCVYWQYDDNEYRWWDRSDDDDEREHGHGHRKLLGFGGSGHGGGGWGGNSQGWCYLMGADATPRCARAQHHGRTPTTTVGGRCNPSVSDDPHFVGAHGTRYDFNGEADKAFCLVSDKHLHVNMLLRGYLDNRTEGATVLKDGKAVRTWIKELGIKWARASGSKGDAAEHSLRLVARAGKQQERGDGFLAALEIDGTAVPRMLVGDEFVGEGGLTVAFEGYEKSGAFDVDFYSVQIAGLLNMDVRLRVAHPLLQTPEEAEVHINVGFNSIENTPEIHGVLGQTYRADHTERAVNFENMAALLHGPIIADGESGKGFLDGTPRNYISSDVMATDCAFSAYQTAGDASDNLVTAS
eukprot:jgi/Mesen1/10274/ME000785S09551